MEQVYIFDFNDKIKAGYSTNVQKRLRTIELSSGVKAKQVYSVKAGRKEEALLHSWLDNRLEGEFFAFPFNEAKELLNKIQKGEITELRNTQRTTKARSPSLMKFCDRLKEARKASSFTQKALAEKLGVSLTAYQYYESGRNAPSLENLVLLADLFDVSLDYLACRDEFLARHVGEH